MRTKFSLPFRLFITVFIGFATMGVFAQQTADDSGQADNEETEIQQIERIVVTARKREEELQSTPVSVTAITSKAIQEATLLNVDQLADLTPGLSFETAFGRQADRPVFRGMSNILGVPNAGIFIDGIFVTGSIQSTELANLERVEIIKGPQNALYGRSTFAGAINYITKKPTGTPEGHFTVSLAEHDQYEGTFFHTGPLVDDRLFYSVSARTYEYGGEYSNRLTGDEVGEEHTDGFSGSLRWLESLFDATFRISYEEDEDGHFPIALQDATHNNCFLDTTRGYFCGVVRSFDEVELNTDALETLGISGLERERMRASLSLNWDFANASLSSVTAYNDEELATGVDQDYTGEAPFGGAFHTANKSSLVDFAQELRLSSLGTGRFSWLAGLYYYDRKTEDLPLDNTPPSADLLVENIAFFGMFQHQTNDRFRWSVELRAQEDTVEVQGGANNEDFSESYTSVNPRLTFDYHTSDDFMWYGYVARGSKPGGINRDADLPANLRQIDEEESTNFELGFKSGWAQNRLLWNVAAYAIDWEKQQLTTTFQFIADDGSPRTISYIDNAGETEVFGLEMDLMARINRNWDLSLGYAYVNAEFSLYQSGDQEALTGNASAAGNQTPRSPENKGSLTNRWTGKLGDQSNWVVRADLVYEGSRFAQIHNFAETGDSTKLNLNANFNFQRFRFSLWGKNITDEDASESVLRYVDANRFIGFPAFTFPRAFAATLPRGRQIGLTATYQF